jgi:uncharacterized protein involved in type VI secretion and phage assembly
VAAVVVGMGGSSSGNAYARVRVYTKWHTSRRQPPQPSCVVRKGTAQRRQSPCGGW